MGGPCCSINIVIGEVGIATAWRVEALLRLLLLFAERYGVAAEYS